MKSRTWIVPVGLLLGLAGVVAQARSPAQTFPHLTHERLFPVCEGCHEGIVTGVASAVYPTRQDCLRCHDGTRVSRVEWQGPQKRVSNLRFSHPDHFARADSAQGAVVGCRSCHAGSGAESRMNVGAPNPALCLQCHEHRSDSHLAIQATCSRCHVPLSAARDLSEERVAALPRPPWHDEDDFLSGHGKLAAASAPGTATCAVCHARETCQRCHANSNQVPAIQALSGDARVAVLETNRQPFYPTPASHQDEKWLFGHGQQAVRGVATCANCHTRSSCSVCHSAATGNAERVLSALPSPGASSPLGVNAADIKSRVHPADIARRHGNVAATGKLNCTVCHTEQTCASCHTGSDSRAFHAPDYVERHAKDVFSGLADCQSCHNTERFCRACHTSSGIAAQSSMSAAFHTRQPLWFLSHGQAARTGLESCASCHRQNDCVRCHSAVGGWRVNPHGKDFPASRTAARNAASCRWCHLTVPGEGN